MDLTDFTIRVRIIISDLVFINNSNLLVVVLLIKQIKTKMHEKDHLCIVATFIQPYHYMVYSIYSVSH